MFVFVFVLLFSFAFLFKRQSLAFFLILIYLVSLLGYFFVDNEENFLDIIHVVWVSFVLIAIISPWSKYYEISKVKCDNIHRLDLLAKILVVFFLIQIVGCLILASHVINEIENINYFKYDTGTTDFFYSTGANMKPYLLAYYFSSLSYLMVPLHFFYLSLGRYKMSAICFLGSLSSIAYGLTYFSRSHIMHYFFLYLACYWLLNKMLSNKIRKIVIKGGFITACLFIPIFIAISISRFENSYESTDYGFKIENPVLSSSFDYLSMWWINSEILFRRYEYDTMNGMIACQTINNLSNLAGMGYSVDKMVKRREKLLGEYKSAFIGVSAYFLYDTGFLLSSCLLILYNFTVRRLRPQKGAMSIERLLIVSTLLLLPLFGIFYSVLNIVIYNLIFLIPIIFYLRGRLLNLKQI